MGKEGAVCRLIPRDLQSVRCEIAFPLQWLQSWDLRTAYKFGVYIHKTCAFTFYGKFQRDRIDQGCYHE